LPAHNDAQRGTRLADLTGLVPGTMALGDEQPLFVARKRINQPVLVDGELGLERLMPLNEK
jgi:hypothetical protein